MRTATLLLVVFSALLLLPVVKADEAKDQIDAFEETMKGADEAAMIKEIEALAKSGNPGASKAISKFMNHRQTAVRVAAIGAVGSLKEKKYFGKLNGMIKQADKDPAVLAAVCLAVGQYGSKGSLKTLVGVAKKWMAKDAVVCSAAATAIGNVPDRQAVDELIKLMDLTFPKAGANSGAISTEQRDLFAASRPAILKSLQTLTGWDFQDAEPWRSFWDKEQKTWKPGKLDIDTTKLKKWVDPGYGFVINKPGDRWVFDRSETFKDYRIYMSREQENAKEAYVFVWAARNSSGMSGANKANEWMDSYRNRYKDIKEETVKLDNIRVGKVKGVVQSFTGRDAYGTAVKVRDLYFAHSGYMFIVGSWRRSGLEDKSVESEVLKALNSFKLTN